MKKEVFELYQRWLNEPKLNPSDRKYLKSIANNEEEINDNFYQDLAFGTAGLRGVLGTGTNKMNEYVVKRATQGLANYLNKNVSEPSVVICYDSRRFSKEFAFMSAKVLSSNGIKAYLFDRLLPVPVCSFTVRYLKASAGIMITASHNPKQYNGYKVYGSDGCQITEELAEAISNEINSLDMFNDIKFTTSSLINDVPEDAYHAFLESTFNKSLLDSNEQRDLKIVYSPLNGAGRFPVQDILAKDGFENITLVKEQEQPDENFTTCPYPNPELKDTLELGVKLLKKTDSEIMIATDPDCDRVGVCSRDRRGIHYYSGNEVGIILVDYIISVLKEIGKLPANPVITKTIVSSDLVSIIAKQNNIEIRDVLTGFKYIGSVIADLEKEDRKEDFLLGFEESCGYLTNTDIRDKDAVNASMLIAEATQYYKNRGQTLFQRLNQIYKQYGRFITVTDSFTFEGEQGKIKISNIMKYVRNNTIAFPIEGNVRINDYKEHTSKYLDEVSPINLPTSNVMKYIFENGSTVTVRPSGTEPKIKIYYCSKSEEEINQIRAIFKTILENN